MMTKYNILFVGLVFMTMSIKAQFVQMGNKLIGSGGVYTNFEINQGWSVDLSGDGKTAIVGGYRDDGQKGAAWVFSLTGTNWIQVGSKIVGSDAINGTPAAQQGWSVSLSRDGKTALVGGPLDNNFVGAAWVFTFSGSNWVQVGNKLVGSDVLPQGGTAIQGWSVSLSDDGKTALIGGYNDNGGVGAAWVFTFAGGNWGQMGNKLVGTGASGSSNMGRSVHLSGDGSTAIIGGDKDYSTGAAWVFTLSGGNWSQVGSKLVGTGNVGSSSQGYSVALSLDGKTAIVGGLGDDGGKGAAWIFKYANGAFVQDGNKLYGSGSTGAYSFQGQSVKLSGDGNMAIVGGRLDSPAGATWVFTFAGGNWTQLGNKLVGTGYIGGSGQGSSLGVSNDGKTILVGGYDDDYAYGAAWVFTSDASLITTSINNDLAKEIQPNIYPNPSNGGISVSVGVSTDYEILNSVGEIFERGNLEVGKSYIPMDFPAGLYFLKTSSGSSKIVIE